MTAYEITIDAEELQQMRAQHEAIAKRAEQLLESCEGNLEEAVEALLKAHDEHCSIENAAGFVTPGGAPAAVRALVVRYGGGYVRTLLDEQD
jgi:hypothetical protein